MRGVDGGMHAAIGVICLVSAIAQDGDGSEIAATALVLSMIASLR